MKVPYSWLKEYVDLDVTAEELQEKLFKLLLKKVSMYSFVIEKIESRRIIGSSV